MMKAGRQEGVEQAVIEVEVEQGVTQNIGVSGDGWRNETRRKDRRNQKKGRDTGVSWSESN